MSFPPRDVLQAEMMFYRLMGIADAVNKLIAGSGLTAEVAYTRGLQYLSVPLMKGGSVGLAAARRSPGAWVIAWPASSRRDASQMAWPLETDSHLLATITAAVVNEALQGRDLPTPFRWGRVETSVIVELADQLIARGVDRRAVQLTPLMTLDDDGYPHGVYGNPNELRLSDKSDPDRTLVVRIDQNVGWSVDQSMPQAGGSGPLDLAAALGLRPVLPRVGADEVDLQELAQLLIEDTFWVDVHDDDQRRLLRYAETPKEVEVYSRKSAEQAAIAWLRWAGFVDPAARWARQATLTPAVELHVDYTEQQVGIGGAQRYKGIAAVNGRTPIVVARAGFSRNARTWADTAAMLAFTVTEDGLLCPHNALAAAYTPTEIGYRPRDCDDTACRTFGCVVDDEFCASNRGRYSDPDAERLRLWG